MQDNDRHTNLLLEDEAMRDGLQIESQIFTLEQKIELFNLLKKSGIKRIQVGSFVHPKIVPQMADSDELIKVLGKQTDTVISALILNTKGLERALACGVPHVSMSVSISDTHSKKNARQTAVEALNVMVELIKSARGQGLKVRGGLQSVFGCVYEGAIPQSTVLAAVEKMASAGIDEINLADTSGMATPHGIRALVKHVAGEFPELRVSLHLHDTRGLGLANMFSGYEAGVRVFDVCAGGLGGCPFVKGAAGNVPTEDAVHMFEAMGIHTGIKLKPLVEAVTFLEKILGRPLPGRMSRVFGFQQSCDVP